MMKTTALSLLFIASFVYLPRASATAQAASAGVQSTAQASTQAEPFLRFMHDLMKPKKMNACVLPGATCDSEYDMCCSSGELCQDTFPKCP